VASIPAPFRPSIGLLVEFDIQRGLAARDDAVGDRKLELRIGINSGDVISWQAASEESKRGCKPMLS
jgi:class 3 adenylate cyclase